MHALASILALSLVIGPAPVETPPVDNAAPTETDASLDAPDDAAPEGEQPAGEVAPAEVAPADVAPAEVAPAEPEPVEPHVQPAEPPAPAVAIAPTEATTPAPEPAPARRDRLGCDGSKSCRRMSIAGIVVGSLGLIGVGVGAGLLAKPDEVVAELPIFVTSTHPPGLVSVTICSGLVLTSVLMVVAAHKGYKQRGLARVRPHMSGSGVGLQF